jgi:hypothetical protein
MASIAAFFAPPSEVQSEEVIKLSIFVPFTVIPLHSLWLMEARQSPGCRWKVTIVNCETSAMIDLHFV